jgi:hypothetical protein
VTFFNPQKHHARNHNFTTKNTTTSPQKNHQHLATFPTPPSKNSATSEKSTLHHANRFFRKKQKKCCTYALTMPVNALILLRNTPSHTKLQKGRVAEWLMAPVLKTGVPERVSGVRIPPLPPYLYPGTSGEIP